MRVDWTSESDEEGTIFVRIHPKDQAERELIVATLSELLTDGFAGDSQPLPATLYGESPTGKTIYGITDDPFDQVMELREHQPILELRVFPRSAG